MRLAFAGTPEFSVAALRALHGAGHDIAAVFTQPDRPAGRGRKLSESAVAACAAELALPVHKPQRFDAAAQAVLRESAADLLIVVAYGQILPADALAVPPHGALNIHASLLPRWRGAAPIQRAIAAGDAKSGVTIMQMDAGLDTGPMLAKALVPIEPETTAADLHDALAAAGARLIVEVVEAIENGTPPTPEPQNDSQACYAAKLSKDEARIDWTATADVIDRHVRAFNPVPMAWTELDGTRLRIVSARPTGERCAEEDAGRIALHDGLPRVSTADRWLELTRVQRAGGRAMDAAQWARNQPDLDGQRLS